MCEVVQLADRRPVVAPVAPPQLPETETLEFYEGYPVDKHSGLLIVESGELLEEVSALFGDIKCGIAKLEASGAECDALMERYRRIRGGVSLCYAFCSVEVGPSEHAMTGATVLLSRHQLLHVRELVPILRELAAEVETATLELVNVVPMLAVARQ